ncbi:MAG: alkaline phosphatase family protein [Deltaproteobacteria bacterium]|nr:alkaline phosphatase family protein [Deltaproteobacteria bacterium]MBI3387998.1 alkaline phosphatase family protein [Deltaproteobacteria bacterium]
MTDRSQVVCIALDAADGELIRRWAAAGRLPTFQRLLSDAAWGHTSAPRGLFVGAVWPSFFTGQSPARHGRYCYQQLRPGTYHAYRFAPPHLRAKPFWLALSRVGKRVGIIDVPKATCGAPLNGIHVTDWGTHDAEGGGLRTWPRSLGPELTARFGVEPVGSCDLHARDAAGARGLRDALLTRIEGKLALTTYLLGQGPWDLFLTVFSEAHCAGHQLWHLHDPTHPQYNPAIAQALGDPLETIYCALDAAVGRLLAQIDRDATVMVLTSHGMSTHCDGTLLLDEVLRRLEPVPHIRARQSFPTQFLPLIRRGWQGAPQSVRRALAPLRRGVHRWLEATVLDGTRRAFQVPNNDLVSGIRVNVVGREPRGLVQRGAEYDAFCDELTRELLALINPVTGQPAVRAVVRTDDLYRGPQRDRLPDLLVEWDRTAPIRSLHSARVGTVQGTPISPRTGDHVAEGLFFARGPFIRPGLLAHSVSTMDFAPTIAALLGVTLPDVDGSPIAALLRPEHKP